MAERPHLRALAERAGIVPEYTGAIDGRRRVTAEDTCVALLAAMGLDASGEDSARAALGTLNGWQTRGVIDPVQVVRAGVDGGAAPLIALRVHPHAGEAVTWRVDLRLEDGTSWAVEGQGAASCGVIEIALPPAPAGYHEVGVQVSDSRTAHHGTQLLAVAPPRCPQPGDVLKGGRAFGICTNLYTLRGERDWGAGDFGDLAELCRWSGGLGAGFCGVNPLHALHNRGFDISPYSPVSRLFRNALYLEVPAVPEFADTAEAQRAVQSLEFQAELEVVRTSRRIAHERIMALKERILRLLHCTFAARQRGRGSSRGAAYADYLRQQGQPLVDFATYMALRDHFGGGAPDWRSWPAAYCDAGRAEVAAFRRRHVEDVDFHCNVQFELDRQLRGAAGAARAAGMGVGLYQDLAIGSAPSGSDVWSWPNLFALGASVGAPPDDYARGGQDWGFPPVHPHRLRADGYRYWIRLLRAALAHSGALRIDHVMGLLRQYWVPAGWPATAGAYVRYPADDLFGLLVLESARHGSLVIGEDLGTVPEGFSHRLEANGILSCRVLYFEREGDGTYRQPSAYSARALATVNTHDHVPLAGFWEGRDLRLQRDVGLIAGDDQLDHAVRRRATDRAQLLQRLFAEGLLNSAAAEPSHGELCSAVHAFLARTPCPLVGLMLDDLVGETEPINVPGVGPQQYASWCRRLEPSVECIREDPALGAALSSVRRAMEEPS